MIKYLLGVWKIIFEWRKDFSFWVYLAGSLATLILLIFNSKLINNFGQVIKSIFSNSTSTLLIGFFFIITPLFIIITITFLTYQKIKLKRLNNEKIKSDKKLNEINLLNLNLKKSLEDNNSYIENVDYIDKTIRKRLNINYKELGQIINQYLPDNLTVIPLKYSYIKTIGDCGLIILFSKTNVSIKDSSGKRAHFRKEMQVIPLKKDQKDVHYKANFEPQTKVFNVLINDQPTSGKDLKKHLRKNNNGVILVFNPIKESFRQYKLGKSTLEMDVNNCFTSKKEFWISEWSKYPILYDRVEINLNKKPRAHQTFIWEHENKRWVQASSNHAILISDGTSIENGSYKICYVLNFQDAFLEGNKYPKFKIEWDN
ncbi:hypothetical protein [Psychroserpens luteus]|uniref:Uncharacterized protein n=1 Tax=Psychroserpens luteus TaxID=1434066 RepID=A0ABW5ZTY1_9FLAO|nr:hypothetical protein [Psychroserpens luteus]